MIDVKYSQHQQSLIQPMDFYLLHMKTDANTKALCTKRTIRSVLYMLEDSGLLKWKIVRLGEGFEENISNK